MILHWLLFKNILGSISGWLQGTSKLGELNKIHNEWESICTDVTKKTKYLAVQEYEVQAPDYSQIGGNSLSAERGTSAKRVRERGRASFPLSPHRCEFLMADWLLPGTEVVQPTCLTDSRLTKNCQVMGLAFHVHLPPGGSTFNWPVSHRELLEHACNLFYKSVN